VDLRLFGHFASTLPFASNAREALRRWPALERDL
jgi:hypothetical protein